MNNENLIPNSARTPSELREMATKGGIASGEARRKKKTLAAALRDVLDGVTGGITRKEYIASKSVNDLVEKNDPTLLKAYETMQRILGEHIIKVEQTAPTLNIITTPEGADALKRLSDAVNDDSDKDN